MEGRVEGVVEHWHGEAVSWNASARLFGRAENASSGASFGDSFQILIWSECSYLIYFGSLHVLI